MTDWMTEPHARGGIPTLALHVEVLEGPDAGAAVSATGETLTLGSAPGNDLVLSDATVSRYHAELSRSADGVHVADHRSTNGTWVNRVRIEGAVVPPGTVIEIGRTRVRVGDGEQVTLPVHASDALGGLRGRSAAMRRLMARVERAAQSDVAVLILGESGTGKEVVARTLHELGPRARKPFVTVDCGALSPTLVASELFGHEKGAFTGADRQHVGAFEQARGGTLFLDEIGELPPPLQPALLGVLERRKIRRVGGREEIAVDVRIVAATHRDLRAEVNAGTFRLDLYYRLAVVRLEIPPLRERPEDVAALVEHFALEAGHDGPIEQLFSADALAALARHHWPGNARELRNLVEAAMAMGEPPQLDADRMQAASGGSDPIARLLELTYRDARGVLLEDFERRYLVRLLERAQGNVTAAARIAKMDRSHLNDLLRRHALR